MSIRDMVARHSDFKETADFIPTPPYATRALYEIVWPQLKGHAAHTSFWDPAAGHGHMGKVAQEYGHKSVKMTDITPFSSKWGEVQELDFTKRPETATSDNIITNPPYAELDVFIREGLAGSEKTLALLVRANALEGQKRWKNFFRVAPPTQIGFFVDRIPFKSGVVVRKAPKMFFHCWLVWDVEAMRQGDSSSPRAPLWIPPDTQLKLQKDSDYE